MLDVHEQTPGEIYTGRLGCLLGYQVSGILTCRLLLTGARVGSHICRHSFARTHALSNHAKDALAQELSNVYCTRNIWWDAVLPWL